jgi:calcineurin-like phosphoesterase family protein
MEKEYGMIPTFDIEAFEGEIWLTADLHLGHKNILKYTGRSWTNIDKHDSDLIKNACDLVKPDDLYIIVGDLTMYGPDRFNAVCRFIKRLPGKKILVLGNHDKLKPQAYVNHGISIVATSLVLPGGILVVHDPAEAQFWPKDKPVICGHVHELFRVLGNVVNVGVDIWGYRPVLLQEALGLCTGMGLDRDWRTVSKERHQNGQQCD